jgi:hypothetical protein
MVAKSWSAVVHIVDKGGRDLRYPIVHFWPIDACCKGQLQPYADTRNDAKTINLY